MKLRMRQDRNVGLLLLAAWLIFVGVQAFVPLAGTAWLGGALAIAAGAFLLLGK